MVVEYHQFETYSTILIVTINVTLSLVVMLAACLCCTRRKIPKNELLGLEGMVKLKNPDEVIVVAAVVGNSESQVDLNLSTISNADSDKRASTAAHRSLPDIPVADGNGDNGSELYETVADKRLVDAQNSREKSPTPSLKKQTSVSQHSSISQADDVSSPYSRVKNAPHDYAKLRGTEHPYAQLNAPSTSATAAAATTPSGVAAHTNAASISGSSQNSDTLNRSSHHSDTSAQTLHEAGAQLQQAEIPAASAIAGMISASQDLPYMTPPIGNQHFSGDSQDSSKGYTSISVREPLANILAQQPLKAAQHNPQMSRDTNDSHYATVSDDSDETYAAIEDPNSRMQPHVAAEIYTSGSETYAQIQPMQSSSLVVSVEINSTANVPAASSAQVPETAGKASSSTSSSGASMPASSTAAPHSRPTSEHATPIPPPVDSLRAQMHSRQASSSSNNSASVGTLGSPKPEKRQANSPLPPTPKASTLPAGSSTSTLASGRNSVISVIDCAATTPATADVSAAAAAAAATASGGAGGVVGAENSPQKHKTKSLSPSKDIEGMYAKVMKKNKFSRHSPSSQNNSPVMSRKYSGEHTGAPLGISALDQSAAELMESHKISMTANEKSRLRSNSYGAKDHGYETIPADAMRQPGGPGPVGLEHRKSDCYTSALQKELETSGGGGLGIGALKHAGNLSQPLLTSDPPQKYRRDEKHYETISGPSRNHTTTSHMHLNNCDPGYETLHKDRTDLESEKKSSDYDPNYEVLKTTNMGGLSDDGYAKVIEKKRLNIDEEEDSTDGYSKVKGEECEDAAAAGYSTIGGRAKASTSGGDTNHNYASILETKGVPNDETESDHYARIADSHVAPPTPDQLTLSSVACPAGDSNAHSPTGGRLHELPIASPSSINSSSLFTNSSTPLSTSNLTTTTSASTMSSRPTPTSSSQYESLTGSDTDPNYESVCYSNTGRENPYERLPTDYSDTQLSSPRTPDEHQLHVQSKKSATATTATPTPTSTTTMTPNGIKPTPLNSPEVVVDDYFQV